MLYTIPCLLGGTAAFYQRLLVREIAGAFGLHVTLNRNMPPHFTLKYRFEPPNLADVEHLLECFASSHSRAIVRIGGFGHFNEEVIFLKVGLSDAAREIFRTFMSELEKIPWMTWEPFEGPEPVFHATIAEKAGPRFHEVWESLQGREQMFEAAFDNISLFRNAGIVNGIEHWKFHRTFYLQQP